VLVSTTVGVSIIVVEVSTTEVGVSDGLDDGLGSGVNSGDGDGLGCVVVSTEGLWELVAVGVSEG
jgi:hypothetical protein